MEFAAGAGGLDASPAAANAVPRAPPTNAPTGPATIAPTIAPEVPMAVFFPIKWKLNSEFLGLGGCFFEVDREAIRIGGSQNSFLQRLEFTLWFPRNDVSAFTMPRWAGSHTE